jgi:hypothetical protein
MRPRDLFGVALRILAIWFWTQAAFWAYWGALKYPGTGLGGTISPAREDSARVIIYVLMGIALMVGAQALTWLAYGDAPMLHHAGAANSLSTDEKSGSERLP